MEELINLIKHSNELQYEDTKHQYHLQDKPLESISKFVSNFYPKFDSQYHAKRIAKRDGKTVDQVLKEWKDKADKSTILRGTPYHNYIENRLKGYIVTPPDKEVITQVDCIQAWLKQRRIIPILTEIKTYDLDLEIAGTMDLLAFNEKTGKFLVIDWKTNKEIVTDNPYKKFMFPPFDDLADNNYNHYCLQINLYRYCLEKIMGDIFEEGYIVHLDHTSNIELYKTFDLRDKIKNIIKEPK
jgi:ATP-dependent exoDNAse (exonuclease V) beta subunit